MDGYQRSFSNFILGVLALICLASCGKAETSLQSDFTPRPNLTVTPYPLFDFGNVVVGQTKRQIFTITNVGARSALGLASGFNLSINYQFEGGSFPGIGGTCVAELLPQASCTAVILFMPQYAGSFSETVRVSYGDSTRSWVTDSPLLMGKGIP